MAIDSVYVDTVTSQREGRGQNGTLGSSVRATPAPRMIVECTHQGKDLSSVSGWVFASTGSITCYTLPSGPITNVTRFA